ncbi:MAG: hypothetical protein KatS3mg035_2158 [Bacteroidia bacterium]|nr:MAG: hypothetical protein KatS3mg035_2158 [Bacteroidia bacterium]
MRYIHLMIVIFCFSNKILKSQEEEIYIKQFPAYRRVIDTTKIDTTKRIKEEEYKPEKTFRIFGDTTYIKKIKKFYLPNGSILTNFIDFKDSLPDGKYYFYATKDSTKKRLKSHLLIEGQYKDGLKEGKFIYYSLLYTYPSKKRYLITYHKGKIEGQVIFYGVTTRHKNIIFREYVEYKYYETNIHDGKQHGFDVSYIFNFKNGFIYPVVIKLFDNGKLIAWIVYKIDYDKAGVTDEIEKFGIYEDLPYYLERW